MKKTLLRLTAIFLMLSLFSCAKEEEAVQNAEVFTPLFRFSVSEGGAERTRLFSLPESEGFFYLHPASEGGYSGGFVSPSRSVSSESVIRTETELSFAVAGEKKRDQMTLLTSDGLYHTLLKENGAEKTLLPEGIDFSDSLFFDSLTLLGRKDDLLVLCPVDFSETFVLADTKRLHSFSSPLAVTHDKNRIWYTLSEEEGVYSGIAFFEYGKNTPMGTENFSFHSYSLIGSRGVLFTRLLDDGGALYLFRDLETDAVRSVTVQKALTAMTCDEEGNVFCGTDGTTVFCFDGESGKETGNYEVASGTIAPSLALDAKGETLLFAFGVGEDAVLATLDLAAL